ncbi:hypothetical protein LTR36_003827 [Oleoguttula mirabilis]|uniref:Rab-GAP TBC domain-containing protein n=1 Tax=Oleoguttula mirabilis TaxID=1507867 RepID=A0AAV9JIN0_9PEZI|nr:hypothetical protein LTR36_003827 [Oleoguttula mirabilis]
MGDLSRRSSRQPLLKPDDSSSFTSFPDPSTSSLREETSNEPLYGLLDGSGPTIFDEQATDLPTDPQSLSAAPSNTIQGVLDHQGAVDLTRRLATLLAERDAHITALTRLAEEYKIPKDRIDDTASRVKQAEQRRLALSTAAEEDLTPSNPSDSSDSYVMAMPIETSGGTIKGLTRMFGGGTIRRRPPKSPASSRSTSRAPPPVRGRLQSIDAQSVKSIDSGWAASLFGNHNKRHDSRTTKEPVELVTQHDPDKLPPTLAKRSEDPQEAAWNKFLMKLTMSRTNNGNTDQSNGIGLVGASHFGQEGAMGQQKLKTLTHLVIGGIPMKLRHALWMELSSTEGIVEPGTYTHYLSMREDVDQNEIDAIAKDVPRTLTSIHQYYANKGDKRLKEVLVAFVGKYESLGYTQGLNTIAGYLCLAIPEDEHAFWMLCNMVDSYFPQGYFSRENAMVGPLADSVVLRSYVKELMPILAKHMDALEIPYDHTVPLSWFFTAFSSTLSEDVLMRVWDIWLCLPGQKTFLFNVALAILTQNAAEILECENEGEYWSYLDNQCKLNGDAEWVNELMKQAFIFRKKLDNVEERRVLETKTLRKRRGSTEALYSPDEEEHEGLA